MQAYRRGRASVLREKRVNGQNAQKKRREKVASFDFKRRSLIYALQLEYFNEIIQLQARIERLEAERDARYREVLTPKQRETLDAKLAEVEKSRAAKAEAKEAAEEAEAEAAIQ